jgi:hypothetical protein
MYARNFIKKYIIFKATKKTHFYQGRRIFGAIHSGKFVYFPIAQNKMILLLKLQSDLHPMYTYFRDLFWNFLD